MTRKILVTGILLSLFLACSKKQDEDAIDMAKGCLIKSETLNDKPFRTYEYSGENRLYRILQYAGTTVQKRYSFDYDTDGRVSVFRETNLTAPSTNFQYKINYAEADGSDSKNRIESIEQSRITNAGTTLLETYFPEYDSKGRIAKYYWKNNYWRYEYDDLNNVTKWIVKKPDLFLEEIVVAEYGNYDGKENIYANSIPVQLVNLVGGGNTSAHNPGSYKFFEGGTTPTQTGVVTFQYSPKDLPTEAIVSLFAPNATPTTQVYKFMYECL